MPYTNELSKTKKLAISGIMIGAYVVVMFLTQSFAFGAYQIRIATSLYAMAAVYPFLIVPLGLANMLSNILMGGLGLPDMIGGFIVGIITAGSCFYLRKVNLYLTGVPILVFPTFLVPIWLSYIIHVPYQVLVMTIGLGQILPGIVGILIVKYLEKTLTGINLN